MEQSKAPELRFRQEDGAEFPAWEKRHLSDIAIRVTRKNTGNQTRRPLTISSQDGLIDQNDFFTKQIASKDMSGYFLLKRGEFAYNKSSSQGYDYGSIKRLNRYDDGALSSLYICFGLKNDVDSDFLESYFDSLKWYRDIYLISAEGARNHGLLNVAPVDFFASTHFIPRSIDEQQKIGTFFTDLDRRIALADKKLATLQTIKKGMLQKIFSQELRFKDDDGNEFPAWKKCKMKDILTLCHGKDYKHLGDGDYPVIGTSGIFAHVDGYMCDWPCAMIGRKGATLDRPHYMDTPFWCVDTLFYTKPHKNHDPKFQYYLFHTIDWMKYNETSGMPSLRASTIDQIQIAVPCFKEQQKIAAYFTTLDRSIDAAQKKAAALRTIKKGLLQKMFI